MTNRWIFLLVGALVALGLGGCSAYVGPPIADILVENNIKDVVVANISVNGSHAFVGKGDGKPAIVLVSTGGKCQVPVYDTQSDGNIEFLADIQSKTGEHLGLVHTTRRLRHYYNGYGYGYNNYSYPSYGYAEHLDAWVIRRSDVRWAEGVKKH